MMLLGCSGANPTTAQKTVVAVAPDLPPYPTSCRPAVPHADVTQGADVLSILARERDQLDRANLRAATCAAFYDNLRAGVR